MTYQIQLRVDTAANYAAVNETYAMGEVCYISDLETIKIGNGVDAWNDLAFPTGFTGTDSAAVHLTVGGEIAGITEKVTPISTDKILIEDSADSNNKKYIQIGNLPGGSDEQAQDAIGTILTDSSTIDFTYNDATPSITASVIQSAINTSSITNGAGFITASDVTYANLNANGSVGTGATQVAAGNHVHTGTYEPANTNIQSHISSTSNPHSVTKAQVGLTNVTDNAQVKKISSSTDNAIIRWDGTTGDTPQNSSATIDDNGSVNIPSGQTYKINGVAHTHTECIAMACSDETTALTTGTGKITFRMPYAFTVTGVRASLTTAQSSGDIFTVDINEGGTSILSTKLTIDNTEKTSKTATTAAVISDSALADDAEITVDIDQIGNGTAKGLKIYLIGHQ